jgi:hypothetical protein
MKLTIRPAHARSVAGARGPVRQQRCLPRLLVHVLADRQRLSPETARAKQGGVSRGREARSATGLARLCLDLRACRLQDGGSPRAGSPD